MLIDEFGESVDRLSSKLQTFYNRTAPRTKNYFKLLDARVAELKQMGRDEVLEPMQRQLCFILAHNFVADDDRYEQAYLARMVLPVAEVLRNRLEQDLFGDPVSELKYIVSALHDFNLA